MKAAKAHASAKKILLMGDIPILINRDSADVWQHQDLFDLEFSAGAPPDIFSEIGQNWGFPIYNWKAIAEAKLSMVDSTPAAGQAAITICIALIILWDFSAFGRFL